MKALQKKGYMTLPANGQVEFYVQSAVGLFSNVVRRVLAEDAQEHAIIE